MKGKREFLEKMKGKKELNPPVTPPGSEDDTTVKWAIFGDFGLNNFDTG